MGRITELGETLFHRGVGQTCIYLFVQPLNNLTRCILWCANPEPATRLIAESEALRTGFRRKPDSVPMIADSR
jgi:hypothetical protein